MVAQMRHDRPKDPLMAELARLWGVNLTYRDVSGCLCESPDSSVMRVLEALQDGLSTETCSGGASSDRARLGDREWLRLALAAKKAQISERSLEPVLVAWDGRLRIDDSQYDRVDLLLEDGREGSRAVVPPGYHRLRVQRRGRIQEATVISAPGRCWQEEAGERPWGVFAPIYALRSERGWGAGDLGDLGALLDTVSAAGGATVATLPILASYLDKPFEPSPYSPVSRLFWNEFFLAVPRSPEWSQCVAARELWESRETQETVARLRKGWLVDHVAVTGVKRRVLEELSSHFFSQAVGQRWSALESFIAERPGVIAYAAFRARVEALAADWRSWPSSERSPSKAPRRVEELSEAGRYHLYCQWLLEEQLRGLKGLDPWEGTGTRQAGAAGLFLDLPVGVHPGGFDVWQHQELFARGMSMGAPPDSFFSGGQDWGCPPLHPGMMRGTGHAHWAAVLKNHMRFADRLRLDHIMALHRVFWIPEGREPSEGVYVSYPTDELYAVLCLESHRHRVMVNGEDLGTVPPGVRPRMKRHGVSRTWILQGSLKPRSVRPIAPIPSNAVASLGTHDMFPLAGFLEGEDIALRLQTRQLSEKEARRALNARHQSVRRLSGWLLGDEDRREPTVLLQALLAYLRDSDAELVLVGLDDLLLEHEPHNVPGSGNNEADWRRRLGADSDGVRRVVAEAAGIFAGTRDA